jgi:predicted enzyme related to lactoylglutathione lyase
VAHFDIYVDDVDPAIAFYQTVFGWTIQKVEGIDCLLIKTGEGEPGIDGGWASARAPH